MQGSQKPIEIFCSYAHADERWRQQLDIHLKLLHRQGLISIWYDRQIVPGAEWAQAIDTHLNDASVILLLISPDFFASDYCYGIEMERALQRHQTNEARVIPILLRPVDWKGAPFAHLQALPTNTKPITTWSNRDEAFTDVATGIRRAITDLAQFSATLPPREKPVREPEGTGKYQIENRGPVQGLVMGEGNTINQYFDLTSPPVSAPASSPERIWNIPPHNPFFTGRDDLLARLRSQLLASQTSALSQPQAMSGLGGIGKTQIAIEYAYQHRQDYQALLWARAESRETLTSSFVEIAALLNLPEKDAQDQTLTVKAVKHWLQTHREWLLILDNADDLTVIREFLPNPLEGHILLTTRAQALGGLAQRIEVNTFTPELGALFLLRRASLIAPNAPFEQAGPKDRAVAVQISQELGGLPLALDQAGAYLEETQCSLSDYQSIYRTRRAEVLKERGGLVNDHPEPVATTWSLSFEKVEQANPSAAELLRLCAFLSPDAIPEEIITSGAEHLGPLLQMVARDPMALNKAIAALGAYSLIRRDATEKTLSIHRLVQAVLRDAMPAEVANLWAGQTVRAVNAAFPDVEFAQWQACERCLPHAQACYSLIAQDQMSLPELAKLLTKMGWYLKERGQYQEAEVPLQQALTLRERNLGSEHLDTVQTLSGLEGLYYSQGKYEEAEPLCQRVLAIYEQQLGPEHPYTATGLNNLALLYGAQGKYEEAEPLYQRALAIREKQLGPEHLDTASGLNNLAGLYQEQRKYKQAELLCQRALTIWEKQLGPEHPNTANSLNNLAGLYQAQGKYEEAELLCQRALTIWEKQLGPGHPNMANSLSILAGLYQAQGKYEEAEPLYQRALAICEQQLGPQHPDTAQSLNNLALFYKSRRKYEQAKPLYERALTIWEKQLGPEHPKTATGLNNLAEFYEPRGSMGKRSRCTSERSRSEKSIWGLSIPTRQPA